ncbi:MAG: nitroreductase family protein [Dehalococcoidia bacterium]|nr:nitroreductase family protein [Dehalococcoidia bacterium]
MNVFDAVRTVLAVREYEDRAVPQEVIRKVVEAAHLTASSMNAQPWRFVVVEEREMLEQLGAAARTGPYIAGAAFAVVVGHEPSRFGMSDCSRAVQSMVLTAWEEGVGSNWAGFGGLEAVNELLGIPSDIEIVAIVPFGYPVKKLGKGKKKRKPLGEIVRKGRWETPFE